MPALSEILLLKPKSLTPQFSENVTSEDEYTLEPLLPLKFHSDKATAVLKASPNLVTDIINKIPPFQRSRQGAPVVRFPIGAGKTSRTTFVDYTPPAEPEKKKRNCGLFLSGISFEPKITVYRLE